MRQGQGLFGRSGLRALLPCGPAVFPDKLRLLLLPWSFYMGIVLMDDAQRKWFEEFQTFARCQAGNHRILFKSQEEKLRSFRLDTSIPMEGTPDGWVAEYCLDCGTYLG